MPPVSESSQGEGHTTSSLARGRGMPPVGKCLGGQHATSGQVSGGGGGGGGGGMPPVGERRNRPLGIVLIETLAPHDKVTVVT